MRYDIRNNESQWPDRVYAKFNRKGIKLVPGAIQALHDLQIILGIENSSVSYNAHNGRAPEGYLTLRGEDGRRARLRTVPEVGNNPARYNLEIVEILYSSDAITPIGKNLSSDGVESDRETVNRLSSLFHEPPPDKPTLDTLQTMYQLNVGRQ